MPLKSGLPAAVRGISEAACAAARSGVAPATSSTSAASATIIWTLIVIVLPRRSALLLGPRGEHVAAVRKRHSPSRHVLRSVAREKTFDGNGGADLEHVLGDSAPHQLPGGAARYAPLREAAVLLLHVEVVPDV